MLRMRPLTEEVKSGVNQYQLELSMVQFTM